MIRWISRRVDPDELMTIIFSMVCFWRCSAAWCDLVGKPTDAPHLHIPPHWRAVLWFACGAIGLLALRVPRRCKLREWALSPSGMGAMFTFVLSSYLASWFVSWPFIDPLIDDDIFVGDPHAWGSMPYYLLGVLWCLAVQLAPRDWSYLYRTTRRPGRLERKETPRG